MTRAFRSLLCAALLLPAAGSLRAQNFGEINGTVTDATGAVMSGASVNVTNTGTSQVRRVTTNDTGNYSIPFLVPGSYSVQVESPGFKTATKGDIQLQVGAVQKINIELSVGDVNQNVEVTAAAPLLSAESTSVGTVIDNERIVELPLNGRDYLQLVQLSPNVSTGMGASGEAATRVGGDRAAEAISVAGQRLEFNFYTLDGVANTDVAYNLFLVRPSIDALLEFKVQTGIYSVEYGRGTSQVSVATKSGTNQFHGALFEFVRNDAFDAREWRQNTGAKNPFRRNQFGFTFGGRVIRDKLFFLSNFEVLKDRRTTQQIASVPTLAMRTGNFSALSRALYDPETRVYGKDAQGNVKALSASQFPNNIIPVSRLDPIALKLLQFYPDPTVSGNSTANNYVRQSPAPTNWEQFTQRIDYNQSANSNWFGRFSWGDEFVRQQSVFPLQQGSIQTGTYQALISNTRVISATVVNEGRFGYTQFNNDDLPYYSGVQNVSGSLGINGLPALSPISWGLPSVAFQEYTGFGDTVQSPSVMRNGIFQGLDNISIVRGKHSVKFGGEIRRDRFNEQADAFVRGSFTFLANATANPAARTTTANSFADYMIGQVGSATVSSGRAQAQLRATYAALYAEDSWKITPRLTMNIGVRYDYQQPWYDKHCGIMNLQMFDPGVGPNGLLAGTRTPILTRPCSGDFYQGMSFHFADGIPIQAGTQYLGRSLVDSKLLNFAPRLGLAYSPNDRWTVRTGFGQFYIQDSNEPRYDMARNLGGRETYGTSTETPNSPLESPWAAIPATCSGWSGPCLGQPYVFANQVNRKIPYVFQWIFNIQRQLSKNTIVEVGYEGNEGHALERLHMWNEALFRTGPNDTSTSSQRRPWPVYGEVQQVDNIVNSNYHALSFKLERRFSSGLTYLTAFTWSKAIDNGSGIRQGTADLQTPIDSYNPARDRAVSSFDVPRRLVNSLLYYVPAGPNHLFGRQMGPVAKVLEGWQIGSILTFSDGTPANVGGIGDPGNIGDSSTSSNLPDATGIRPIPANRSASNYWNIQAFNATNPQLLYRWGNSGRNVLRGPGIVNLDASLLKETRIRERQTLEFRFETFNLANHPNWLAPPSNVLSPSTFGVVTAARPMRELQFGLKYLF